MSCRCRHRHPGSVCFDTPVFTIGVTVSGEVIATLDVEFLGTSKDGPVFVYLQVVAEKAPVVTEG